MGSSSEVEIWPAALVSYNSEFELAFIERSLLLVQEYRGPYDATLLLNCLLGLLVVPKESCLAAIPADPIHQLPKWGIDSSSIKSFGNFSNANNDPHNLRGFVWRLRNAVAHFRFRPEQREGEVVAFHFEDKGGFKATVPLTQLRVFVERLATHIKDL